MITKCTHLVIVSQDHIYNRDHVVSIVVITADLSNHRKEYQTIQSGSI